MYLTDIHTSVLKLAYNWCGTNGNWSPFVLKYGNTERWRKMCEYLKNPSLIQSSIIFTSFFVMWFYERDHEILLDSQMKFFNFRWNYKKHFDYFPIGNWTFVDHSNPFHKFHSIFGLCPFWHFHSKGNSF